MQMVLPAEEAEAPVVQLRSRASGDAPEKVRASGGAHPIHASTAAMAKSTTTRPSAERAGQDVLVMSHAQRNAAADDLLFLADKSDRTRCAAARIRLWNPNTSAVA